MSNECKCTNPDGGGTRCPAQHLAVCIRGKDKECYGRCVPIPSNHSFATRGFKQWLDISIEEAVREYALNNYRRDMEDSYLDRVTGSDSTQGGNMTFHLGGNIRIYVQFSYEFSNDVNPLGGLREVSIS